MSLKRGNTYKLTATIDDIEDIEKIVFALNNVQKVYKDDGTGDIQNDNGTLIIKFEQEDTLAIDDEEGADLEVAIKYKNGDVVRSCVQHDYALRTIIEEAI